MRMARVGAVAIRAVGRSLASLGGTLEQMRLRVNVEPTAAAPRSGSTIAITGWGQAVKRAGAVASSKSSCKLLGRARRVARWARNAAAGESGALRWQALPHFADAGAHASARSACFEQEGQMIRACRPEMS